MKYTLTRTVLLGGQEIVYRLSTSIESFNGEERSILVHDVFATCRIDQDVERELLMVRDLRPEYITGVMIPAQLLNDLIVRLKFELSNAIRIILST